jgi:tRNA (cmo5U34)-methyltransferase
MNAPTDEVWKSAELTEKFLAGVRGAVPLAKEQIEVMLQLIAASMPLPRRVLDLGCGDGILAAAVLARFPEARVVLVDFSEPMLVAARRRLGPANDRVEMLTLDYGDPGWIFSVNQKGPFDAVVSGFSIHHQPDERKRNIYAEIFGLLGPGGAFINVEHVASSSAWCEQRHDEYFIESLLTFARSQGRKQSRQEISVNYYDRPDKAANLLAPVEQQCQWLREIGFADVDCYLKIFELAVFGGRRGL